MAKRNLVSVLIALLFLGLAVTGIMGFFLPFHILIVSVHSLLGFIFIAVIGLHIANNFRQLKGYFSKPSSLILIVLVVALIATILWQPQPVKAILGLSRNLGPEFDRFELKGDEMHYYYSPASHYKMQVILAGGPASSPDSPASVAIWIENGSGYHIKSLHHNATGEPSSLLPYWHFKRSEYLKYKLRHEEMSEAERAAELDAMSSATENESFDPKDYIVPDDPESEVPFRVMVEINLPGDGNDYYDDQPSIIYEVEVDNRDPQRFQVLDIVGYPVKEGVYGETVWSLHFADQTITSARDLLDSALLRIDRSPAVKR